MKKLTTRVVRLAALVLTFVFSPGVVAVASFFVGFGLVTYGVFLLFGQGWALLAASLPFLLLAVILLRGIRG